MANCERKLSLTGDTAHLFRPPRSFSIRHGLCSPYGTGFQTAYADEGRAGEFKPIHFLVGRTEM